MALWGWYTDYLDKKKGKPRLKEAEEHGEETAVCGRKGRKPRPPDAWLSPLCGITSVTLPSSFALKQKNYLLYNFISFLKFY